MSLFAIRGTKIVISHRFRRANNSVPVEPVAATITIYYYDSADDIVTLVNGVAMVADAPAGQYKYAYTVPTGQAAHSTLYVSFNGAEAGGDDLSADTSITVLDLGGFGGGLRASLTG